MANKEKLLTGCLYGVALVFIQCCLPARPALRVNNPLSTNKNQQFVNKLSAIDSGEV